MEKYIPNFISPQEESELSNFLDKQNFGTVTGGWSALNFGEPYRYTGSPTPKSQNTPVSVPDPIKKVMDRIRSNYQDCHINQCTINKYSNNSAQLSEHSDNESTIRPESNIFTVSLGAQRDLTFRDITTGGEKVVTAESRSLYFMSQPSQFLWTHRMDPADNRDDSSSEVRYSLTFRCVGSNFTNSCIILGDSNTQHLAFGERPTKKDKPAFGHKLPGKRVQAYTINDINPEDCIGYQNVIVHVGVNNLKSTRRPMLSRDTRDVDVYDKFSQFRDKLAHIRLLCPKANIIVSPILPTKLQWLNERALEFNHYLFQYLETVKHIKSIDFNEFVDMKNGLLKDEYGCYKNRESDMIHLGRKGIGKLATLMKDIVLISRRDFRDYASVVRPRDITGHLDRFVIS